MPIPNDTRAMQALQQNAAVVAGRATIQAGQLSVTVQVPAVFEQSSFSNVSVTVALNALDATLLRIAGDLSADGTTLTITGNANATAPTQVSYVIQSPS